MNDFRNSKKNRDQFDCAAADAELPPAPNFQILLKVGCGFMGEGEAERGTREKSEGELGRTSPECICDAPDPRSALIECAEVSYYEACISEPKSGFVGFLRTPGAR